MDTTLEPVIEARGLIKKYEAFCAVQGIDFTIHRGEFFGFLGPNGAGKTSVMRIMYAFMPPTEGTLHVFGRDITDNPSLIKARLGVMPQDDNLDPDLSVYENLLVYANYFDIPRARARERARTLMDFVELKDWADTNILKLSGGMRRRLLLARCLLNEPELIILDEPTTGMDPHSRRAMWKNLSELKARGTTFVLTTHYMEEAERMCDRVAIMDRGLIVAIDAPRALMQEHECQNLEEVYLRLTGRTLES